MDNIAKFISESVNTQTIIICVLVIVIAIIMYRNYMGPTTTNGKDSAKPNADNLLDKLEQSGAIKQQPQPSTTAAPQDPREATNTSADA